MTIYSDGMTKAMPLNQDEPLSGFSSGSGCNASTESNHSALLFPDSEDDLCFSGPDNSCPSHNTPYVNAGPPDGSDESPFNPPYALQHVCEDDNSVTIVDEPIPEGQEDKHVDPCLDDPPTYDPGTEVTAPNDYGVGIDVHRDFIYVTVLVKRDGKIFAYEKTFETTITTLREAKDWCISTIESYSSPPVKVDSLSYTCESTASYHFPLLATWGGNPAVVNPTLAKSGRRKTDRLDSHKLAEFDLEGTWARTFVIPTEIHELRSLIRERDHYSSLATKVNNRITNTLTRFGCTISREGSVTKDDEIRKVVEGILADPPVLPEEFCAMEIPLSMREMLSESLCSFDSYIEKAAYYMDRVREKAYDIQWEVGEKGHTISGEEAINLLVTTPQVGEYSAIVFLANIITPFRFPNAKALAAYCGLDPSIQTSANKRTSGKGRGGNKTLHYLLTSAANRLLHTHNEMFGEWGHRLTLKGTSHNKARNAIARKLAVAMYYVLFYGTQFSYDKYTLTQSMVYLDIPIDDLVIVEPGFKRYIAILKNIGINTTGDLIRSYVTCNLDHVDGLGPKFFKLMKNLMANQTDYRRIYKAATDGASMEK